MLLIYKHDIFNFAIIQDITENLIIVCVKR